MTLTFAQGHIVTGEPALLQSFCSKVAWSKYSSCDDLLRKGGGFKQAL